MDRLKPKAPEFTGLYGFFHDPMYIGAMRKEDFRKLSLGKKIQKLYTEGTFVVGIRYYAYKINLYLLGREYVEVFYNHKYDRIDKIEFLNHRHSRMKFYLDQIKVAEL